MSSSDYSLRTYRFALTWPHCPIVKEEAATLLEGIFRSGRSPLPTIEGLIVSEERHKDGTPHLHAGVWMSRRVLFSDAHFADLHGHHGSYEHIKSPEEWKAYLTKDGNYLARGAMFPPDWIPPKWDDYKDKPRSKEKKRKRSDDIADHLVAGGSVSSVIEMDPGFGLLHLAKIQMFRRFLDQKEYVTVPLPWIRGMDEWNPRIQGTLVRLKEWMTSTLLPLLENRHPCSSRPPLSMPLIISVLMVVIIFTHKIILILFFSWNPLSASQYAATVPLRYSWNREDDAAANTLAEL